MPERLQKFMAARGVASRRRAEELIAAGHVTVNDVVAQLGQSVDPDFDVVQVFGHPIDARPDRLYFALHKPTGIVTSLRRTHGESTILDLIDVPQRVFPVGRLDRDTSGLLLLTNDGEWANLVMHPSYGVEKEYRALMHGRLALSVIRRLESGVRLESGDVTSPARVSLVAFEGTNTRISLILIEGRKRQIRMMGRAVGHPVIELKRTRIDGIDLGSLRASSWRRLTPGEVSSIIEHGPGVSAPGRAASQDAGSHRRTSRRR